MTGFQPFRDKGGPGRGSAENPTVRITSRKIHLGAVIHREILDETERIEYLTDPDGRIGLRPVDPEEDLSHAYSARNAEMNVRSVWLALGVEIDGSHELPLDTESEPFPVIDVSEFIGGDPSAEDTADGTEAFTCEVCGDVFDSKRGRNIHAGRMHGGEDEAGDEGADSETTDSLLDHERVATAMDSIGIDADVPTGEVVVAIDEHDNTFGVGKYLGISRADADDLIRRLDLADALNSDEGLARGRFEAGEGGASA